MRDIEPYKTQENVVRAEILAINERAGFPDGYHLVKQGRFTPGGKGTFATVEVVCVNDNPGDPAKPFSVHTACLRIEQPTYTPYVYLMGGTYDLAVDEAVKALEAR